MENTGTEHGIEGFVIPTKSFVKIRIPKIFCHNKMFSSINKTFGCCSKIFGCSNKKKYFSCPQFCCRNKTIFFREAPESKSISVFLFHFYQF